MNDFIIDIIAHYSQCQTMITYVKSGEACYAKDSRSGRSCTRSVWEFEACVEGQMTPRTTRHPKTPQLQERTLWVFPPGFRHGWRSDGTCNRVVLHFSSVPAELLHNVPDSGYYQVALTKTECERIVHLAEIALRTYTDPSDLDQLLSNTIVGELSILVLDKTPDVYRLHGHALAHRKAANALTWYVENMGQRPSMQDVAQAVSVSPSHLRRLFHTAREMSPQEAFSRARLDAAAELICDGDLTLDAIADRIGLSDASSLSRAVRNRFGVTPRDLRDRKDRILA